MLIKSSTPDDPNAAKYASFVAFSDASVGLLFTKHTDVVTRIEEAVFPFRVEAAVTATGIGLNGDDVGQFVARRIFEAIIEKAQGSYLYQPAWVNQVIPSVLDACLKTNLAFRLKGLSQPVKPESLGQVAFMRELLAHEVPLVIGTGPTGTGKTHLAIAAGLSFLAARDDHHLVMTRRFQVRGGWSAPDQGDPFGVFYDILHDLIGRDDTDALIARGKIEIAPFDFVRGRTFHKTFFIVDDAQDFTVDSMRMAVTRMGRNGRTIVIGDPAQAQLPMGVHSGVQHLMDMVGGADFARIHHFENRQIIRNATVAQLDKLYSEHSAAS